MKFKLTEIFKKNEQPSVTVAKADTTDYASNEKEFKFIFNDTTSIETEGHVISIGDLQECKISDTLTIYKNDRLFTKLDFRYKYHSTSKQKAIKFDRFVAVGLSGYFYLYDLSASTIVLFIDFNGYFDEFKICDQHLFVAYNSGIYCLTKFGSIKWHNNNIGLDGIIITEIKDGKIYGSEQIDPPGGWKDFVLDFDTGKQIERNGR